MVRKFLRRQQGQASMYLLIGLFAVVGMAILLGLQDSPSENPVGAPLQNAYTCCDTGNGEACQPRTDKQVSVNGDTYALLKSNVLIRESSVHFAATNVRTPTGERIFLLNNQWERMDPNIRQEACVPGLDKILASSEFKCMGIEDDLLVYACKAGSPRCDAPFEPNDDMEVVFDVYIRITPGKNNAIPNDIKQCDLPTAGKLVVTPGVPPTVVLPPGKEKDDTLQIDQFSVTGSGSTYLIYQLSPFCKPAVYLYPEQTMPVNVQVEPKGKMLVTIPAYPKGGWNVIAHKNGQINVGRNVYEYLYYEAEIADKDILGADSGYVIAAEELEAKLPQIVRELGLNTTETNAFVEYWLDVLPKAPYYVLRVVPQETIDTIAPLSISPAPESVLRVALQFEPLTEKITLSEPEAKPFIRKGFTVVEWGGMFKRKPGYEFSCFM